MVAQEPYRAEIVGYLALGLSYAELVESIRRALLPDEPDADGSKKIVMRIEIEAAE